jgi:LacI family transcriptional regulator, galactose operon repressor
MKDVAALAGVSLSTVSRTVNGDPTVAPELADRVRHAVELLGYQRDEAASALRRADRVSASLAIIVEDVANPFFSAVHRGVEDYARERRVLTFAGSSDDDAERERDLAEAFVARRVDGLVIAPAGHDHRYLERERAAGLPLVFVDRPGMWIEADAALSDNAGGARAAIEHLRASGHERIAYLGDRSWLYTASERLSGYRAALGGRPELVRQDLSQDAAYEATRELLSGDAPPTALFTAQNLVTLGAVRALHDLGLRERVAHVSFDDVPLADALSPGLTVVAQDPHALGRAAAELLFARMDGDEGPPRQVVLPTRLVVRGSGELRA